MQAVFDLESAVDCSSGTDTHRHLMNLCFLYLIVSDIDSAAQLEGLLPKDLCGDLHALLRFRIRTFGITDSKAILESYLALRSLVQDVNTKWMTRLAVEVLLSQQSAEIVRTGLEQVAANQIEDDRELDILCEAISLEWMIRVRLRSFHSDSNWNKMLRKAKAIMNSQDVRLAFPELMEMKSGATDVVVDLLRVWFLSVAARVFTYLRNWPAALRYLREIVARIPEWEWGQAMLCNVLGTTDRLTGAVSWLHFRGLDTTRPHHQDLPDLKPLDVPLPLLPRLSQPTDKLDSESLSLLNKFIS
jgi:hypothetical protein